MATSAQASKLRGVRHPSRLAQNPRAAAIANSGDDRSGQAASTTIARDIRVTQHPGLAHLHLEDLSPTIGTVVHGVDMAATSDEEVHALYQLLLTRKVIFFRDQHCAETEHIDFARRFGELEIHPFNPMHPEYEEIIPIDSGPEYVGTTNTWHSDVMWRMDPSLGSILRARAMPDGAGGDTLFCDMYAAYEGLPEPIRAQIDGLFAENGGAANGSKETARKRLADGGADEATLREFDEKYANLGIPAHPVVRTHPDTGRQALYVNRAFTRHIVGMERDESKKLLELLYRQADFPEYQCRFKWQVGSVAFWDNRACQHYGVSDYFPHVRKMERVTIAGDRPYYQPNANEEKQFTVATPDAQLDGPG